MPPEQATAPEKEASKPTMTPISVTRNDVPLTLELHEETKGKGQGTFYLAPKEWPNSATLVTIIGEDYSKRVLALKLKKVLKELGINAGLGSEKGFDETAFIGAFTEYKFRAETMAQLNKQIMSVLEELFAAPDDEAKQAEIKARLHALKKALDDKQRTKSDEDEDEEEVETPAAN